MVLKLKSHTVLHPLDWIKLSSDLRPRQHSMGYMGDGFYRSKDPTNSIFSFLPARRYASVGYRDRNVSVCPSVCHAPVLCQNKES